MSNTLQDYRDALDDRISAAAVSGFWDQDMKDKWINDAGIRVCNAYRWSWLELALKTYTRDLSQYYDYPPAPNEFKKNSIYQIDIEDENYPTGQSGRGKRTWEQFQIAVQNEDQTPIFANHNGYYFLQPVPENSKVLTLYGLKAWKQLVDSTDESIAPEEFEEAIVRTALAACLRKAGSYDLARVELVEVYDQETGLLKSMWDQEQDGGALGYGGKAGTMRFG